jgi:hypothetical protein
MLAGEITRYRRRRQNLQLPQDPTTDRWLKRLGWCAIAVLVLCLGIIVRAETGGPRWLATTLLVSLFTATGGLALSVVVLGWRNGMRIARSKNRD